MVKKILIWLLAFIITSAVAIYQRISGPTHPTSGSVVVNSNEVHYKFLRSENVGTDLEVKIITADSAMKASVVWKRFKSNDDWAEYQMNRTANELKTYLPSQPAAGKLEYYVQLICDEKVMRIPEEEPVIARYKGEVPTLILILHVIAMFGAMLLSTRTGLEFFKRQPKLKNLTWITIIFLFIGGLILGPVVQKYAFDAYWTGWPFGHDLTDNKTAVALIGWLVALLMYKKSANPKRWALFAAILLFVVYLIPHSVLGSEIDYTELDEQNKIEKVENDNY
ncbi:MAG: hypothetical protein JW995_13330 [Melioribacteraceae bacterium]|nr:hypothetical protein [Melioribacteraceae bacterium]